jgi:Na+-transporting methylmalonyl-CoA/oxaloacetate decarboxylase gamma subunit
MTIVEMVNQGDVLSLLMMGIIIVAIMAMIVFFKNELIKVYSEPKSDQPVVSTAKKAKNEAVTAAISAAVNEYEKNN